jgi:hypothetical protein
MDRLSFTDALRDRDQELFEPGFGGVEARPAGIGSNQDTAYGEAACGRRQRADPPHPTKEINVLAKIVSP